MRLKRALGFVLLLPLAPLATQSCGGSDFSSQGVSTGGSGGTSGDVTEGACTSSKMCPTDQVCDTELGECVECASDRDCADTEVCAASECRPACESTDDCAAGTCDVERGFCIECSEDGDCKDAEYCSEAGACHDDECEPGKTKCGDGEFLVCADNGSEYEATPCEVCSESGNAHCVISGSSGGAGNSEGGANGNEGGAGGEGPHGCAANDGDPCSSLAAFEGEQDVDAKPDDFCSVAGYVLNLDNADYVSPIDASGDSSAVIHAAWSDNTLRVHVAVTDPNILGGINFYDGDNVQFFISGLPPISGGVNGTSDGGANQIFIRPNSNGTGDINVVWSTSSTYEFATRNTNDGYEVELSWTWPIAVLPNSTVGFDIIIGVKDNEGPDGREYEYGLHLGEVGGPTPCSTQEPPSDLAAWCDDRTWCSPTLE